MTEANEDRRATDPTRLFTWATAVSLVVGSVVFLIGFRVWDTHVGVVVAALLAGATAAGTWLVIAKVRSGPNLDAALTGIPMLGAIPPDDSGPAPAMGDSETAHRYTGLLREIEGQTTGSVLLVSSPSPGQGSSTVAMNVAIAATRAGRRVMLIDADHSPGGISRYLSSGRSPGLSDVANGDATLRDATRMWHLDDGSQFPMLPSGDEPTEARALSNLMVADAIDTVSEQADLVLIDVPPVLWSDATPELGRHADGTILVLSDSADAAVVAHAVHTLDECGAPVVGYVRNRSKGTAKLAPAWYRIAAARMLALAFAFIAVFAAVTGFNLWYSWQSVETESYDQTEIQALAEEPPPIASATDPDEEVASEDSADAQRNVPNTTAPEESYQSFLLIGGDEVSGAADVILYLVLPTNSADPFMVSLPRDLYVDNPCTGRQSRINALIHGCASKDINGPSLLAYQVGQFTGITVDHFARFDFDGFEEIIDAVGGVEICVDYPVRDERAELSLNAGCTQATGAEALGWVRTRHTQQLVGGSWKSVPGASDLQRNQHQQDVILQLFTKLKTFESPSELTATVASLANTFTLDDQLSITDAVNLAWRMRAIDLEDINRIEVPVRLTRSTSGQSILVATEPFDQVLIDVYGGSLPNEDGTTQEAAPPSG